MGIMERTKLGLLVSSHWHIVGCIRFDLRDMTRLFCLLVLGVSVSLIQGCAPNDVFHKKSKGKWVTKKSYNQADTLVIKDYALYNSRGKISLFAEKSHFEVDKDSLLTVLLSSLKKLGLENIKIKKGSNIVDSTLYLQEGVRIRHFDESRSG
jgi:hypothetical protein